MALPNSAKFEIDDLAALEIRPIIAVKPTFPVVLKTAVAKELNQPESLQFQPFGLMGKTSWGEFKDVYFLLSVVRNLGDDLPDNKDYGLRMFFVGNDPEIVIPSFAALMETFQVEERDVYLFGKDSEFQGIVDIFEELRENWPWEIDMEKALFA